MPTTPDTDQPLRREFIDRVLNFGAPIDTAVELADSFTKFVNAGDKEARKSILDMALNRGVPVTEVVATATKISDFIESGKTK